MCVPAYCLHAKISCVDFSHPFAASETDLVSCAGVHASCDRAAVAYLLSGHRAVEATLRLISNPVMPSLVVIILAIRRTAATGLRSAADVLQLS